MYKIATLNKISPVGLGKLTDEYTLVDDISDAHGIIVRSQNMHDMSFSDNLLAIARAGAGVNNIPLERCAQEGIVVFNTPGANANAVKELVIAGLILGARNISEGIRWTNKIKENVSHAVEKGKSQFAGTELKGKTLGVIGLGAIGVLVANTAQALGMKVVGYDPFITLRAAHSLSNTVPVAQDLSAMLADCDFITLHLPATENTTGMFDSRRFAQLKNGCILLNFSRDKLVNERALIEALAEGKVSKYVTDFPTENLLSVDNVISLPHIGASTREAEDNCAVMASEQLMEYIEKGNIVNSVNFPDCSMGELNKDAFERICILNKNIPSMLGKITGILSDLNVNIRDLTNKSKGDVAVTLIDVDSQVEEQTLKDALNIDGIISIRVIGIN